LAITGKVDPCREQAPVCAFLFFITKRPKVDEVTKFYATFPLLRYVVSVLRREMGNIADLNFF
jgi:hypothetical protein